MNQHIRNYRTEDGEAVLDIWLKASRAGHPFFSEEELLRQYDLVKNHYLPVAEMWVYDSGTVQGFIGMLGTTIGGLFVLPQASGKGIGARLIRHVADMRGPLTVEVFSANTRAFSFYRRSGFIECERSINMEVVPHQEFIIMRQQPEQA
ncbi:GNAT family N-acetyltransferase [Desulfovibrio subterraneus]|uniref:GNAT family N-acetyltransferase n=1 Tax=Desulfovibrio subterraneus TaxID=2718620 RepID=UPI0022B92313|nr:GNAT family N-acetyltransferase [Desulfovibrio subterraneus]WBF66924.1 GNAT family N-acetyltransferase [Desulfovibrio subterraneus]